MHSVYLSGFVYIFQSDCVFETRAFLFAFLFLRDSRRTSRLHHGWLKRVDVYLEGTYLLTLSVQIFPFHQFLSNS